MKARIYHNPRCSKSRATLALLTEKGIDLEIVEYLKTPLSKTRLRELMRKLDGPVIAMLRTDEPEFEPYAQRDLGEEDILELLAATPRLLQRPIVEVGDKARIGRPPERVLELF